MARIIDQFGRKRCQKKRKDVDYKLLLEFFQKYFVVHKQSAVENSFSTYVCYAPDGLFWLNLYFRKCCHSDLFKNQFSPTLIYNMLVLFPKSKMFRHFLYDKTIPSYFHRFCKVPKDHVTYHIIDTIRFFDTWCGFSSIQNIPNICPVDKKILFNSWVKLNFWGITNCISIL